jgi:hypothetical protein
MHPRLQLVTQAPAEVLSNIFGSIFGGSIV